MASHLALKSLRVCTEEGILKEHWCDSLVVWSLVILQDVEGEGNDREVSDGHGVANEELLCSLRLELLLDNLKIFGQDSVFPRFKLFSLFIFLLSEEDLDSTAEHVSVCLYHHVDNTSSPPVRWVVVTILDSK